MELCCALGARVITPYAELLCLNHFLTLPSSALWPWQTAELTLVMLLQLREKGGIAKRQRDGRCTTSAFCMLTLYFNPFKDYLLLT